MSYIFTMLFAFFVGITVGYVLCGEDDWRRPRW